MNLSRNFTNKINWILDNVVPPLLRDSKLFMGVWFKLLFGDKSKYFMEFKEKAPYMTEEEYKLYYKILEDKHIKRESDLNSKSIDIILEKVIGNNILDIACGRGCLAKLIVNKLGMKVTGIDIYIANNLKECQNPVFYDGKIENIEFDDKYFDTVICAHTLEHVQDITKAINELRRVTKKRLIIVVPCQREYKYTFDLHIHFFPYLFSLQNVLQNSKGNCYFVHNDIIYIEDILID